MGRKCLKCKYERVASDSVPEYECPKCGAIYAKVEAAMKKKAGNLHLSDGDKIKVREASTALEKKKDKIKKEKPEKENNKLTKCRTCGKEISKTAKTCPHCGEENPVSANLVSNESPGIFSIVVAIFFVLWIVGKFSGTDDDSSASESNSRVSDTECRESLQCWGERHNITAAIQCDSDVERLAKYSHKWTDGIFEPKFSHFLWKDEPNGVITFIGDKIQFQNGFGAWQNYIYECDYNPISNQALDVRARAGVL
jgi:predicted RNA-binding Zn-ribbon protein involved in translation (DUF1610 family)